MVGCWHDAYDWVLDTGNSCVKRIVFLSVMVAVAILAACSNRQVYEAIQNREKVKCQELPRSEYADCMKRASETYETYKKNRREVENE